MYCCLVFVLLTHFSTGSYSVLNEGVLYYKNSWVVEIPNGVETAKSVAAQFGFIFINPVWLFENHFVFLRKDLPIRHRYGCHFITNLLQSNEEVEWAEQQFVRARVKKDSNEPIIVNPPHPIKKPVVKVKVNEKSISVKFGESLRNLLLWLGVTLSINNHSGEHKAVVSKYSNYFNDPMWNKQWYTLRSPLDDSGLGLGMGLMEVYRMNITGRGVRVAIVDDGVDITHPDLQLNYDREYSFDFNHNRSDVTPLYKKNGKRFTHGTKCAGVLAMAANNEVCGVGVAYDVKLAAVKMLEQPGVDVVEGQALRYRCEDIDIFSNSWGPGDNGWNMEGMGTLSGRAMEKCLQIGRQGKGSIYLFPAGNGKWRGDNCGADAYSNSLYVMTIASVTRWGTATDFSEQCAAIFAATYSRGPDGEGVVVTGPDNECHNHFGSTSASVPMAAGIIALALQANTNLTYRDVKHLVVMSSEVAPLAKHNTWKRNGAGFWVSSDFGFGLMNAKRMVDLAQSWQTVPGSRKCAVSVYFSEVVLVQTGQLLEVVFNTSACSGKTNEILFLEQLQLVPFIRYGYRGAISIHLTSPTGTTSTLLSTRINDKSSEGLIGWPLKSVQFWGENPSGTWMLQIKIHVLHHKQEAIGNVKGFLLIFSGTFDKPHHYKTLPRIYKPFTVND